MEVYEITGYKSGKTKEGVNYLQPADSFQNLKNGFIHRQVLQSRKGIGYYTPRLAGETRIMGIFEFKKPDGTRETLVFDKNFLYKYNEATNVFDQKPFAGSMAGYAGFDIGDNESYVSGVSYPTKDNGERFVFTGVGITANAAGSGIFYYDGTDIKDYTNVVDNADYEHPVEGAFIRAKHVVYHNERINFVVPTIVSPLNQAIVYSGIRDAAGNGEKFNVAGSGVLQFSTYESIKGIKILGQDLVVLLEDSARVLEITSDAFNPYKIRNIPSFIGTDASFSAIGWNNIVNSIGKAGILQTDGRTSLHNDTKIPYFTNREISQRYFELTYGGFDRLNGQFLWSYKKDNFSDDETQDRILVRNYEEDSWSTYDMRVTCFGTTEAGQSLTWDDIDETSGNPSWNRWDTTEETWNKIGIGRYEKKTIAGDDLGFIYEMNVDSDDHLTTITDITQDEEAVVTVDDCALKAGDKVVIEDVSGMTEINNFNPEEDQTDITVYTILAATPTSLTINVDSSLFTAYVSGGKISKPIDFYAETIPLNPFRQEGRRLFVSHVDFLVDSDTVSLKVDVFQDTEQSPFIRDYILKPSLSNRESEWVSMPVNNECEFIRFGLKHLSPSNIFKQTSMRLYFDRGGYING